MIPNEVLAQVRRIEIRTRRLVAEMFGGQYLSVFKGRGMEFAEVREYVPGDDVRTIDWNVTARARRPYVRRYQDERELTVMIACDMSGSQFFGSDVKLKKEIAAEIAALLAFAAMQNNDKVGLFLFTEGSELYIPPKKGHTHVLALIRDLLAFKPARTGTSIGPSLDTINRVLKRKSILFLISDFIDENFDKALRRTAIKHDLVPIVLEDPRENQWPAIPVWVDIEDPESGHRGLIYAKSSKAQHELPSKTAARRAHLDKLFNSSGLEAIRVKTNASYVEPLIRFFRQRAKRFR